MGYQKQTWIDGPGGNTPVSAERLTNMEKGIAGSGLLASVSYEPAANTTKVTSSTVFVDVDSTNLVLPDFRSPDSGVVFVRASGLVYIDQGGNPVVWNVRDAAGDVAGTAQIITKGTSSQVARCAWVRKVAVAPDTIISGWRLGWRVVVAQRVATIEVGATAPAPGALLLEVWSTPL